MDTGLYGRYQYQSIADPILDMQDRNMKLKDLATKRKREEDQISRQENYRSVLSMLAKNKPDLRSAEGQEQFLGGLASAGFAPEAMELRQHLPDIKTAPKAEKQFKEAGDVYGAFDPEAGTFSQLGTKPKEAKAPKWEPLPGAKDPTLYNPETKETFKTGIPGKPDSPRNDGGIKPEHVFSMEQKLSNDFRGKAGKSIDVATAGAKINEALNQNNPLDAYNAIVQFVKIIDPGTAAREGEVSSAVLSASGGVGAKMAQAARKAYNGTLDPETIKNIRESAAALMRGEKKTYDAYRKEAKDKIDSYNKRGYSLDEKAILGDFDGLFETPAAAGGMPTYEQFDALPSGSEFTDPQGNVRRKP